jgi:hypothetical protein
VKVECPVCGIQGFLEVRGNSQRVPHYRGLIDGKRVYEKHSMGIMGINGNKQMGINSSEISFFNEIKGGRSLAWSRIPAWGAGDPGFKSQRPHHF